MNFDLVVEGLESQVVFLVRVGQDQMTLLGEMLVEIEKPVY